MGKYVLNYTRFVNESTNSTISTAEAIISAAGKYIEIEGYLADNYSTAERLSVLTDELASQIQSKAGETAADAFKEEVMTASINFVSEDACQTCTEMMEPCEACKKHAEEMKKTDNS
jgi:hypothetical protein